MSARRRTEKRFTTYKCRCSICKKFYQKEKVKRNICILCSGKRFYSGNRDVAVKQPL